MDTERISYIIVSLKKLIKRKMIEGIQTIGQGKVIGEVVLLFYPNIKGRYYISP